VFEIAKSLRKQYRRFGEETTEEVSHQAILKNSQWRRQRDVLRQSFPQPGILRRPEKLVRRQLKGLTSIC